MPVQPASSVDIRRLAQDRGPDAAIARLADDQHGVVARWQLLGVGFSPSAIDRRLRLARLHRLHRGVYAVGHRIVSRKGRWMAAILACERAGHGGGGGVATATLEAVLSHRSAAALWGILSFSGGPSDVTLAEGSRSSDLIRRHRSLLATDEVTVCGGIPVTTVPRTVLDLAAVAPAEVVESALREAEYLRLHDPLSLPDLLTRHPGQRGARTISVCLARRAESAGDRIRSRLEERFLAFLDCYRLPRPRLNTWVEVRGRRYEIDCLWPGSRQIIELDGWGGHGTRIAFREDRARDRRLRVAGYGVTRLTWAQLNDEPKAIAADLRRLIRV